MWQQHSFISSIPQPQKLMGHHTWLHNQFPPFFLCSPLPSEIWQTPGLSSLWCLPTFFLSALSSSPFLIIHGMYHRMSASARRREITPQLFAAWGRTQERTVAACPTRPRVVFSCPPASAFEVWHGNCETICSAEQWWTICWQNVLANASRNCMLSPLPSSWGDHMPLTGQIHPRCN